MQEYAKTNSCLFLHVCAYAITSAQRTCIHRNGVICSNGRAMLVGGSRLRGGCHCSLHFVLPRIRQMMLTPSVRCKLFEGARLFLYRQPQMPANPQKIKIMFGKIGTSTRSPLLRPHQDFINPRPCSLLPAPCILSNAHPHLRRLFPHRRISRNA